MPHRQVPLPALQVTHYLTQTKQQELEGLLADMQSLGKCIWRMPVISELVTALKSSKLSNSLVDRILALHTHFSSRSRWIICSDTWSYDLGASGLHHATTSGLNFSSLIPFHIHPATLLIHTVISTPDWHKGPSVVLTYLPYQNEDAPALEVLKETKVAVD
ncbi:hypothetical protein DFH29DRAFT_1007681 [Suillus ampliporus]|nr:hypothetical protein DFH29DRAFT_1007681 [Suillus ampliporus]